MSNIMKTAASALALLLALPACAQTAPATQDADPALWVVKDKDTTIYLFGTVHVLKPGLSWFDEAVKKAFDRSDTVALELVMPDQATMQSLVVAKGMAPADAPPLTEQLPPAERPVFTQAMGEIGVPPAAADRFRPWLAATYLSVAPLRKLGYDPANGPEQVITAAAGKAGKPVIGLETADQQLGYFASLSNKAQLDFLTSTIDELPTAGKEMAEMVDDWSHGQPDKLAALLNDDLKDSPELEKVLLTDRNGRWAHWVADRMKRPGTVFIAVGAGHLAGAHSVQAQLVPLGYKAQRVNY